MTTYNEIRKITSNNKAYAAAAMQTLTETCWWVSEQPTEVIYLRTRDNDWVAIPDAYSDEIGTGSEPEFTTVRGKSVILSADDSGNYIAIEAE
jgi:hypothetical protein